MYFEPPIRGQPLYKENLQQLNFYCPLFGGFIVYVNCCTWTLEGWVLGANSKIFSVYPWWLQMGIWHSAH